MSNEFPMEMKTTYFFWYKDLDTYEPFTKYLETNPKIICMDDVTSGKRRSDYITDGEYSYMGSNSKEHIYGPLKVLAEKNMFGIGLNPDFLTESCMKDKFLILEVALGYTSVADTKILGVISGDFAQIKDIKVFKRSATVNLLAVRYGHSGGGTNLLNEYLNMLKILEVNVCFVEAVPAAIGFYFNYQLCYMGSCRYGYFDPIEKDLFAINVINHISVYRPHMQRESSASNTNKRSTAKKHNHNKFSENTGVRLKLFDNYDQRLRWCFEEVEKLAPGQIWKLLNNKTMRLYSKNNKEILYFDGTVFISKNSKPSMPAYKRIENTNRNNHSNHSNHSKRRRTNKNQLSVSLENIHVIPLTTPVKINQPPPRSWWKWPFSFPW